MGLDMYLKASKYVGGWEHFGETERALYASLVSQVGLPGFRCENSPSAEISVNVAYWRKANQVHAWFVREVQEDRDECQEAYVEREKLVELRDLCKSLFDSKDSERAAKELPPASWFFFGGTEIDDGYWSDLEDTVVQLNAVLFNPVFEKDWSFAYQSSW